MLNLNIPATRYTRHIFIGIRNFGLRGFVMVAEMGTPMGAWVFFWNQESQPTRLFGTITTE